MLGGITDRNYPMCGSDVIYGLSVYLRWVRRRTKIGHWSSPKHLRFHILSSLTLCSLPLTLLLPVHQCVSTFSLANCDRNNIKSKVGGGVAMETKR